VGDCQSIAIDESTRIVMRLAQALLLSCRINKQAVEPTPADRRGPGRHHVHNHWIYEYWIYRGDTLRQGQGMSYSLLHAIVSCDLRACRSCGNSRR
jgi:hypothetical protein